MSYFVELIDNANSSKMIYSIKRLIKLSICVAFVLVILEVNAQVALVQKALDKMERPVCVL